MGVKENATKSDTPGPGGMPLQIALLGAKGMLAQKIRQRAPAWAEILDFDLPEFDLTDFEASRQLLIAAQPDIMINCAAFTAVDACEEREEAAYAVNGAAVDFLAQLAEELGAFLIHLSTDYVFDGFQDRPYRETDPVAPSSAYGRTKLAGERAIMNSALQRYLIVRTSWLYGPGGKNFVKTILRLAAEKEELRIVADQIGSPTYTGHLAEAIYRLIKTILKQEKKGQTAPCGICHFSNAGQISWHGFAVKILALAREQGYACKASRIVPIDTSDYPLPAKRPAYSVLSTERYRSWTGCSVPEWQEGLGQYMEEVWTEEDLKNILSA